MTAINIPPELASATPATKLVYSTVTVNGPVSQAEIRSRTSLSGNTVRTALDRLEAEDLVERRLTTDARSHAWAISDE